MALGPIRTVGGGGRPRPSLYATLRRVHLWLTLLTAPPLLVLSLTGAYLVYGEAVQHAIDGFGRPMPPGAEGLSFRRVVERLAEQAPEVRPWSISAEAGDGRPRSVWLADGAGVAYLDPLDGTLLVLRDPHGTLYGTMVALHRWLLVDGPARPMVRHAVSATTLVMMVQILLGLWLWWLPPTRWRNLKPDFRRSVRTIVFRLHQLAGVTTALLLFVIAFTGIAIWWTGPTRAIVEAVAGDTVAVERPLEHPGLAPLDDLDAAVRLAEAALPGSAAKWLRVPRRPGDVAVIGLDLPDASTPGQVVVGDAPARVLAVRDGRTVSRATWAWELRYRIHMGEIAGGRLRPLWLVTGLMPGVFVVSGIWLWLQRRARGFDREGRGAVAC